VGPEELADTIGFPGASEKFCTLGDPFWLLYDQDDAPYATVDRALAEWYAKWIRAMDRIGI